MENVTKKVNPLTEGMKSILAFLQANEGAHFCDDIAAAIGSEAKKVSPVLTALKKRELVVTSEGQKEAKDKNGNTVIRTYKMYSLTEAGAATVLD